MITEPNTPQAPCPIFSHYEEYQSLVGLNDHFFSRQLSTYLLGRLEYVLSEFIKRRLDSDVLFTFSNWREIVDFALQNIAPNVEPKTWSRYRTALSVVFNTGLEKELAPATFIRGMLADLVITKAETLVSKKASKAPKIEVEELYYMRLAVIDEQERLSLDWLEFNIHTNLRPNELASAEIYYSPTGHFLRARNTIKSDATKLNIEQGLQSSHRNIDLSHLSFHDFRFIEEFLMLSRELIDSLGYQVFYERLRLKLRALSLRCFQRSISLSVGRTQFAANHKSLKNDNDELADLMGHTDPTRPLRSYGRKTSGYTKLAIKDTEEISALEQSNEDTAGDH